ncbi:hypothetical protein SORBI_3009G258800 [Sorghum bicolor]|uniref:Uncharacterized protein n=1 Tax=Sorghum bicolor TaxID=4558 RepID=A0A1B6PAG5_SORBI|nr:hypothetical protein SORBI_3009G258800 [Sorghum bicolor]KXG22721.1 hypothetical protein SORBI_3009G258800 [Sorghum bicolor]OQU78551.1 hypothetical protein SORBI_3009G258800 [Sorghum bicolor]OQU78552.1 hypothetical protein SORBI_3009G258800 [Sorghum bicolor]OQU78553.1 hypothetical protein SORBI_3009G258800 [Sorghum bicolor]
MRRRPIQPFSNRRRHILPALRLLPSVMVLLLRQPSNPILSRSPTPTQFLRIRV